MTTRPPLYSSGFIALLATQFLGAFNDNAFKLVISLLAVHSVADRPDQASRYVAAAGAMLTLPFVLFSSYAGFLADRFSKKSIIVGAKGAEVAIMALGFVAFLYGNIGLMMGTLFLIGVHSTFFSPAKYGILPEICPDEDLSKANGALQLWTFLAMILGTAVGGQLLDIFDHRAHRTSIVFIGIAMVGFCCSRFVTDVPASASKRSFQINFLRDIYSNVVEIKQRRPMMLCVIGSAYFWFICALYQLNLLLYAKNVMKVNDTRTSILLTAIGLGVAVGSLLAGRWSDEKVEFGLVPIGATGMGVTSILLGITYPSFSLTLVVLLILGTSCGFFAIPLSAYLQQQSPPDGKGRILATNNFIAFCGMFLSSAVLWLLADRLKIPAHLIFVIFGILSFGVIIYICRLLPDVLVRFLLFLIVHTLYRIKIIGKERIPKTGGALLVCNHVSFADATLVLACTQRLIRFVAFRDLFDIRWLRPLLHLMKAIPISTSDSPRTLVESLTTARDMVRAGELVCIFAEGSVTRTGNTLRFGKGLERIMKNVDAPIIPVHLDRVWGSIFSFDTGKILNKLPTRIPYPVTISFGMPLPSSSPAVAIRDAVLELGSEAFRHRGSDLQSLPARFCQQAKRCPKQFCMADSGGARLSYGQAFTAALALSRVMRRKCGEDKMIGIMLPNSTTAALVNVAVSILGKCPVNLNFTASAESLSKSIQKCGIRHIFSSRDFVAKANIPMRDEMVWMEEIMRELRPTDRYCAALAAYLLPPFLLRRLFFGARAARPDQDLATVMFSSGSTGDPKGVMLTHVNIGANIEGLYQVFRIQADDIVVGILPLFHSFGFTGTLWFPLATGLGVVYHHNPLDFAMVGEITASHRATILLTTPTFLMGYIRKCTAEQFQTLRYVVVGAEKLKERIAQAFTKQFSLPLLEGYGCTELSPIVAVNVPDAFAGDERQVGLKPGTIGHPLPNVAAKVVDSDTLADLPPGEAGLLLIKGPNVMVGYLGDEEKTREVIRDGWYNTGDIAVIDEDGFITIKDRLSRFSKIGGEMVPHIRIEEEIHARLGVAREQVCAVTSIPDDRKGELLVVLYRHDLDADQIHRLLAESELPKLWIPKRDAFFPVDELPLLATGKLDLKRIRAIAMKKQAAKKGDS